VQSKLFSTNITLNCAGSLVDISTPKVMGILNLTPDSFFDGGKYPNEKAILAQVEIMLADGATFVDVGGYSTRPGAMDIPIEEELRRVVPVINSILKNFPEAIVSIDTFRSEVARRAVDEGAAIVNDVSGGQLDPLMFKTIASLNVPYVLMHSRGTPQTMVELSMYDNLIGEVVDYFHQRIGILKELGVKDVIVDPGFGFAKDVNQNFELLNHLGHFRILGRPLLVGLSRKSMIWKTLKTDPEHALNGTIALNTIALQRGASILRVHDVKAAIETIKLTEKLSTE
jgi:dihydropteroate synthase